MDVYKTILSRRSIRRFKQKLVKTDLLKKLVNAARLAPSAANLQPVEYLAVNKKELCQKIFENIGWAGYLKDWQPSKDEQPMAYIIMLISDTENPYYLRDVSLASENIVLAAEEEGIGSCILCNIKREKIKELLNIPDEFHVDSVIALGYKDEKAVVEDIDDDSIKYWRDNNEVMHVPKKKLEKVMHLNKF